MFSRPLSRRGPMVLWAGDTGGRRFRWRSGDAPACCPPLAQYHAAALDWPGACNLRERYRSPSKQSDPRPHLASGLPMIGARLISSRPGKICASTCEPYTSAASPRIVRLLFRLTRTGGLARRTVAFCSARPDQFQPGRHYLSVLLQRS